ncbi:MAG: hypothetical protein V3T17_05140 [Pseudomonadales bacterium]
MQGDKLSLQSLLNELVNSPMVVRGAIYNVENRPIAEAGEPSPGLSFSASITFQDSLAGYAVITFDTEPLHYKAGLLAWQLLVLALLLTSLVYLLSLIPARLLSTALSDLSQIARSQTHQHNANTQVAYPGEDELQQLARDIFLGISENAVDTTLARQPPNQPLTLCKQSLFKQTLSKKLIATIPGTKLT